MLHSEIIAVCSQSHTKHVNVLYGQNVHLLNVKLVVHIVTTGLYWCQQKRWISYGFYDKRSPALAIVLP
jgi:hypothetical protein